MAGAIKKKKQESCKAGQWLHLRLTPLEGNQGAYISLVGMDRFCSIREFFKAGRWVLGGMMPLWHVI
jgi:hypothetical protein